MRVPLDGLNAKLPTGNAKLATKTETGAETGAGAVSAAERPRTSDTAVTVTPSSSSGPGQGEDRDDVELLVVPEPCVLCGRPAGQRVAGFAQHLDPSDCQRTAPATGSLVPASAPAPGVPTAGAPAAAPAGQLTVQTPEAPPTSPWAS
ncbi:hypothetical protein [Streptomyces arboris]|uniref:hypothetical protein n=1 Tax=Streptomyces arboris TaxID=2600619 RepID=UPI003C30E13C